MSGIRLRDFGSFHVPGHDIEVTGADVTERVLAKGGVPIRIDPNGTTAVGQVYVQYFLAEPQNGRPPVLFIHGGSLTGVTWETTPDGREGWLGWFLRHGWDCYNLDAVERGRAGWSPLAAEFAAPPMLRTLQDAFPQFRLGGKVADGRLESLEAAAYPGSQFPLEAFGAFMQQVVPRWDSTDGLVLAAYDRLLARLGRVVIVAHSQGAAFAQRAAERRPEAVAAMVLVEPAQGGAGDGAALAGVPMLAVYGDFIERDARWPRIRARNDEFQARVRAAGGRVDVLDLPAAGVYGNSHMLMMERNNAAIAARVNEWLGGLDLPARG